MNEIKFRAFDGQTMFFFDLKDLFNEGIETDGFNNDPKHLGINTQMPYQGMPIMQFIGFVSVDKKPIYNGDILHVLKRHNAFNATVKWRQQSGGFYLSIIDTDRYIEFNELEQSGNGNTTTLETCRIIGNIHEVIKTK